MAKLRRQRRDRRARAPKKRKKRNLSKFIPNADSDFAMTARNFVSYICRHAEEFTLPEHSFELLERHVEAFRKAFDQAAYRNGRTQRLVLEKNAARKQAEASVREVANIIRADPKVGWTHKMMLRLSTRPKKLKKAPVPKDAPELRFLGCADTTVTDRKDGMECAVHVLEAGGKTAGVVTGHMTGVKEKPPGAARLELFFDFVPPGQPIPSHPAELSGWPRYLRSFTKRRMEVEVPQSHSGPMLVVYWGRWAGANGEVGRFSKPCVARWEGANVAPMVLPEGNGRVEIVPPKALPAGESTAPARTQFVFVHAPQLQLTAATQEPREVVDAA